MEMAKFQNDFVVMTTTLEPKCFQIVYKAAKGGAKWQLLFLKQVTRYKFRIPDTLSRCFKKKMSINSFFTNTDGIYFYKAPAFVVSNIVHIALNLGSSTSIISGVFAVFSVLHIHFSSLGMKTTINKLFTLQYN